LLSKIIDPDLDGFGISFHVSSTEPGDDVRRGLSSSRCIASTGKKAAAAVAVILETGDRNAVARLVDGEGAQLVIGVCSKFICR
jgi:hypothetical protein